MKKVIPTILALILVFVAIPTTTAFAAAKVGFADVDASTNHFAEIFWCQSRGYIHGYQGCFRPDDYITRAEFAQMVYNVGDRPEDNRNVVFELTDVDSSAWYAEAATYIETISIPLSTGVTKCVATFNPEGNIDGRTASFWLYSLGIYSEWNTEEYLTRAEACALLETAINGDRYNPFNDHPMPPSEDIPTKAN